MARGSKNMRLGEALWWGGGEKGGPGSEPLPTSTRTQAW